MACSAAGLTPLRAGEDRDTAIGAPANPVKTDAESRSVAIIETRAALEVPRRFRDRGAPAGSLSWQERMGGGYVLIVARFVHENTVSEFLEAAEVLGQRWPVAIIGSTGYGGELDDRASALAARNERISWLGHVIDDRKLFSLWQHAGAYFHGHSVCGTSPALVQAMSCAVPTVARDTPHNRRVLAAAGEFVESTPQAIIAVVTRLMEDRDRQEALSCGAFEPGRKHSSWEGVCPTCEQTLLRLNQE